MSIRIIRCPRAISDSGTRRRDSTITPIGYREVMFEMCNAESANGLSSKCILFVNLLRIRNIFAEFGMALCFVRLTSGAFSLCSASDVLGL